MKLCIYLIMLACSVNHEKYKVELFMTANKENDECD